MVDMPRNPTNQSSNLIIIPSKRLNVSIWPIDVTLTFTVRVGEVFWVIAFPKRLIREFHYRIQFSLIPRTLVVDFTPVQRCNWYILQSHLTRRLGWWSIRYSTFFELFYEISWYLVLISNTFYRLFYFLVFNHFMFVHSNIKRKKEHNCPSKVDDLSIWWP